MYGKLMSIPDTLLWSYYELLTDLPSREIGALRSKAESAELNPRDAKARLAHAITAQFHGEPAALQAQEDFRRAFSKGELPETIDEYRMSSDSPAGAARLLVEAGLAASMRQARRKIAEGAMKVYEEGAPREVRDPEEKLPSGRPIVLRLGRRFLRIIPF